MKKQYLIFAYQVTKGAFGQTSFFDVFGSESGDCGGEEVENIIFPALISYDATSLVSTEYSHIGVAEEFGVLVIGGYIEITGESEEIQELLEAIMLGEAQESIELASLRIMSLEGDSSGGSVDQAYFFSTSEAVSAVNALAIVD